MYSNHLSKSTHDVEQSPSGAYCYKKRIELLSNLKW